MGRHWTAYQTPRIEGMGAKAPYRLSTAPRSRAVKLVWGHTVSCTAKAPRGAHAEGCRLTPSRTLLSCAGRVCLCTGTLNPEYYDPTPVAGIHYVNPCGRHSRPVRIVRCASRSHPYAAPFGAEIRPVRDHRREAEIPLQVSEGRGVLTHPCGRLVGSSPVRSARKPLCFFPEHRTVYSVLEAHSPLDIGVLAPRLHCRGASSSGMWEIHIPRIRPKAVPNSPDSLVWLWRFWG